jgi:hypothetical protein
VEKQQMMMDFFIKDRSKILIDQKRMYMTFSNRYLGGFSEKRMIQIAAGSSHCLGLTDVSLIN